MLRFLQHGLGGGGPGSGVYASGAEAGALHAGFRAIFASCRHFHSADPSGSNGVKGLCRLGQAFLAAAGSP
eukprot:257753-Chlamydomonas_euryale.AAC.1